MNGKTPLEVLRDFVNRAVLWQPGGADRHAALQAINSLVRVPPCQGKNCGSTDDRYHSVECYREHDEATAIAQPAEPGPTMADAVTAGDGTLHGAIDHWQERALKAEKALAAQAAAQPVAPLEDPVTVPRGLLGAACAAIDRKHDAPKTLAQLRRYTVGDLSATAPPAPKPEADAQPVAPEIDYDALIAACFERTKYRQGSTGCVQFAKGAEWFREQIAPQKGQPRLTVRLVSYPESNGKRNWTAQFVRVGKWGGLIGSAGGITIAHGELWNRVAYEAERAKFLLGERDTEPFILDYGDDIKTPEEWKGEMRGSKGETDS